MVDIQSSIVGPTEPNRKSNFGSLLSAADADLSSHQVKDTTTPIDTPPTFPVECSLDTTKNDASTQMPPLSTHTNLHGVPYASSHIPAVPTAYMKPKITTHGNKTFHTTSNPYEKSFGYHRAVRKGPFIFVSGTTSLSPATALVRGPGDAALQAEYAFYEAITALEKLGGKREDVCRVKIFVAVSIVPDIFLCDSWG